MQFTSDEIINVFAFIEFKLSFFLLYRLCGLVVRVPGYRSRGPGSIYGTTRFSEKQWFWKGVHSAT
jgi:hypothetical protein